MDDPNKDSHLVVEQGLFSKGSQNPAPTGQPSTLPTGTEPVASSEEQPIEASVAEYENASGGLLSRLNLFWALLIPMVIIEVILLILIITH